MPPSSTRRQQRFMYAELNRAEKGEQTQTGMSIKTLKDFAKLKAKKKAR